MRHRAALVLIPVLVLLAGCAPEPPSSASNTTPPSSSPAPSSSPESSATPSAPAEADLTTAELVELCTEKTRELAPDATYHPDRATTEWLEPVSSWFVVIPKDLGGQESAAVCGIRGDRENPIFEMNGEALMDSVDQLREDLLAVNDGHDG